MKQLSVYRNSEDTTGKHVSLKAVIDRIIDGKRGLDEKTRYCNALAITDKKACDAYKAENLPAVIFSGTFPRKRGKRKAQYLVKHSGLVTLDIDGLTAEQIPQLLAELAQMPHVVLAFISPSGKGIKVILRVDPIPANDLEHKGAYQVCFDFFEDLMFEYGFKIDTSGKDCSRLCYLAHDPLAIFHENAPAIDWDKDAWLTEQKEKQAKFEADAKKAYTGEADVKALDFIDPNDLDYNQWLSVITACKHSGLSIAHTDAWSRRGGVRYTEGEVESRWHGLHLDVSWGAVVNLAKSNGYIPPPRATKAKLHYHTDCEPDPTQTLDENEKAREASMIHFGTDPEPARTQIHIVSDHTGGGKTFTVIMKAKTENKKTLASLPFYEQAEQVVNTAASMGFSPFFIKGREHGWEASGIEAIPVEYRTESLFENENVGCIMCDKTREYQAKRQPARLFCETKCPYRETCLDIGHLSQYKVAAASDFIATCTPNLLFDPTFKGYLNVLVNLGDDDEDDEDLGVGFTDKVADDDTDDKQVFDTAIVDDFVVNALYPETHTTLAEIQELRDVWIGTPTETFAENLLPAFTETDNAKIFDVLESAVKSLSESDRSQVNETLTKHGRVGTIHRLDRPKGSAETKRLLTELEIRFVDGGRGFIPDSAEAEKELNTKSFPCVSLEDMPEDRTCGNSVTIPVEPYRALQLYKIPLKELTPVWQRDWTLLDQIEKLITTTGTRENAPVCIKDGILSMSLPPQDSGLVDNIALLSPTDESEAIKQALTGQDIDFHVHKGKPIDFADDVKVYQLSDYRLTSASTFEYKTDENNKRILQEKSVGLKAKTLKRFEKLNDWARNTDGLTAFISYKDIADDFTEHLDNFDVVTHFDRMAGLNLDGLKLLVVYGYPKVNHIDVIPEAIKQFSRDTEPIPSGDYESLTEEKEWDDNGILIKERRYIDSRLESIRKQLATEKLNQAVGRARLPRWTGTTTIIFTNAPIQGITNRAELFTDAAFTAANHPRDFADAQKRVEVALESGDVQAVMETTGQSESTARRKTQTQRQQLKAERDAQVIALHEQGKSQREIHKQMAASGNKVSIGTINSIIQVFKNGQTQLSTQLGLTEIEHLANPDDTSVERKILHTDEVLEDYDTFFKLFDISICFYGKKQRSPNDISKLTSIDESEVRRILEGWYRRVSISPGVGDQYWMTERDKENLNTRILAPALQAWIQKFPDQKILCPPITPSLVEALVGQRE